MKQNTEQTTGKMVQMLTSWTMQTFIQSNNVMRVSNENRLTLNRHIEGK